MAKPNPIDERDAASPGEIDDRANELARLTKQLKKQGVEVVAGWVTNASNLVHAKTMPIKRLARFVESGAGMSPVHHGYSMDNSIQFTEFISAIGDLRMRLVPEGIRRLSDTVVIAPTTVVKQDGEVDPAGPRYILEQTVQKLRDRGLEPTTGYELEFGLVNPDGSPLDANVWTPYGMSAVLDQEAFFTDLAAASRRAGLDFQQIHAEFGTWQMEVSLAPSTPVEAADAVIAAKTVIGHIARKHGMLPSFSPLPFAGAVGNGAHQHFALTRDGRPLLAGGDGPHGLTPEGASAIAGIVHGLPDIQALLCGSILSGSRLQPGMWSGAYCVWGVENREAAVRLILGGQANPDGTNVEVKIVDPSANPYASAAAVLGLMLRGIDEQATLPEEATDVPGDMDPKERKRRGYRVLPSDQADMLKALESGCASDLVGPAYVAATLAVRRNEIAVFGKLSPDELCARLRFGWTI